MASVITPEFLIDCAVLADNEIALEINGQHETHNVFTTQQVIITLKLLLDKIVKVNTKTEVSIIICHLTNVIFTYELEDILQQCLTAIRMNINTNIVMFQLDGIKINDESVACNLIAKIRQLANDNPIELHLVNCFNKTTRDCVKHMLSYDNPKMSNIIIALYIEK